MQFYRISKFQTNLPTRKLLCCDLKLHCSVLVATEDTLFGIINDIFSMTQVMVLSTNHSIIYYSRLWLYTINTIFNGILRIDGIYKCTRLDNLRG